MRNFSILILIFIFACDTDSDNTKKSDLFKRNKNTYSYGVNNSRFQSLDYYANNTDDDIKPALIWIHGGSWVLNSKSDIYDEIFEIAEEGNYHLISIGYRYANDLNAPWPSTIIDVNTAIRWIKKNSDMLNIDMDRLYLVGNSAGAHLAALSSSTNNPDFEGNLYTEYDSEVTSTVLISGVYNFNHTIEDANLDFAQNGCALNTNILITVAWLIDCEPVSGNNPIANCDSLTLDKASSEYYVNSQSTPMMIYHGKQDCIIPWSQAEDFYNVLQDNNVRSELYLYDQGEHGPDVVNLNITDVIMFLEN